MAHRLDPMTRAWVVAGLLLAGVIAYACTTDTNIGPDVALDSLYIEPMSATIVLDDTMHFTAVGVDSAGRRFVTTRATWSSSDPTVTLEPNGSAIGIAVGTATIQAQAGGRSAMATLTVTPKPIVATSRDSVPFSGIANGPNPPAQTVTITNAGGGILTPVVDSVRYGAGSSGWLQTAITSSGGGGIDTLDLTATTATLGVGTYSATVFLGGPKATPKSIVVTFVVGVDAPFTLAIDSGDAQTATVNTAVPVRPSVLIRDQYNNPVPSASVTFTVIGGGGSVAPAAAVATDGNGRARVTSWTLGTAAGANALQVATAGVAADTFTATGTAGAPAATSKQQGDTQSTTVNSAVPIQPTLRVTDQFGNPVESVTVTFTIGLGGGNLTGGTRKTDGTGLASVGSWTLGTGAGSNTLNAVAASLPAETFSAIGNPAAADSITLNAGDNQTDTVKATLTAYSVRVADQFGNGVSGTTVTWGVSGGGSITPTSLTNSSGIASATRVFGQTAGPQGATATVAGLVGSPVPFTATATHGVATTTVKFAGDNQSATVDSAVALAPTAKVTDAYGNPVPGVGVTFAVTAGGGIVAPTTAITTNAAGTAAVTSWHVGPSAGTNNNTLTASASGLSSVGFIASGLSGSAKNLVYVSGNGLTDTIGAQLSYTVRVTDINGNGVQGVPVSWVVTMGGGTITASTPSDVNGFATATRTLGTSVGIDSATGSVGGLTGSPQRYGATATHGNPSLIFKTAGDLQSATVNTTVATAPRVQITDRATNPIQSASVTFTVSGGGGSTSPSSPAGLSTDAGGFAQLTSWTLGQTAGANAITVSSAGTPGAGFSATGTAGAPSASQSSVTDNSVSIIACAQPGCTVAGSTADSVHIIVRDQFNNPVSGATVTISSTGTGNAFSPSASGTSSASGVFTAKLNSTVAQAKTISASATTALGGGAITQTAAVTVNPTAVSIAFSSVAESTDPITACQASCLVGSTALTLTATARDSFNNAVPGASVTLSSNGSNNYFNGVLQNSVSGSAGGAGTYSATFNSGTAQLKTLSASITSGVTIGEATSATVSPAGPSSVTVANEGFSARVGTGVGILPTFTVRDAFSNLVPNFAVSYSSSGSGAFSGPATTNASGQATLSSWTMAGTSADDASGRMANNVTLFAGAASNTATDYGIYTYSGDASPILSGCDGCHYVNWTRANIVGQPDQNPSGYTACSGYTLVTASNANASLIYLKTAGTAVGGAPPCGGAMPSAAGLSAATRKILRAWINNGAPNN